MKRSEGQTVREKVTEEPALGSVPLVRPCAPTSNSASWESLEFQVRILFRRLWSGVVSALCQEGPVAGETGTGEDGGCPRFLDYLYL